MRVININNFISVAEDYTTGRSGEFSISKQFDILTFPNRLYPLRGMETESTTNSKVGNIIVSPTTGLMYGVGTNEADPTYGKLWYRNGYGASDTWRALTQTQLSGGVLRSGDYDFLVENPNELNTRKMYWASTNLLVASDPNGASAVTTQALTFSTISQGFVHPKDKNLYFSYQTSTKTYIAKITPNATPFTGLSATALELPSQYRVYSMTNYGDYLAIGATTPITAGGVNSSVVILWDRDTTLSTLTEIIPWGAGTLKVLNNLNGVLVGISQLSTNNASGYAIQDTDKISIKAYSGGVAPITLKELITTRIGTTPPSATINNRVNFIYDNRLYFSINLVNGDSDANYYGLWSFGLNKYGNYSAVLERTATNDHSDTGVIAAAIAGDFVCMAHTTEGTLTATENGNSLSAIWDATSFYESSINPEMPDEDKRKRKNLVGVYCNYLKLPADGQVVMKYRVDSTKADSWTTIFTETTTGVTRTEKTFDASGNQFTEGTNYEFRLESTDGAIITGWGYKYDTFDSQI